ncbi:hypothetical protein UlMin_034093 [Ulmus minor]
MPYEDWKPVKKKEEVGSDREVKERLGSILANRKKKVANSNSTTLAKSDIKEAKVKKEELWEAKVNKEEKVDDEDDDKPLAKRSSANKRDSLRIIYEILFKQVPNSEMAQFLMIESSLLSKEEAKKVFEKKHRRSTQQKLRSPIKLAPQTKKRKIGDESSGDDFVINRVTKKKRST